MRVKQFNWSKVARETRGDSEMGEKERPLIAIPTTSGSYYVDKVKKSPLARNNPRKLSEESLKLMLNAIL